MLQGDEHLFTHRYNPDIHHRKSIRLKDYDYSQAGAYYVTIVTHERRVLFGDVVDGEMRMNETGQLVVDVWEWLAVRHPYVQLDSYVVMPNHLHGVIVIDVPRRGDSRIAPTASRQRAPFFGDASRNPLTSSADDTRTATASAAVKYRPISRTPCPGTWWLGSRGRSCRRLARRQ